MSEADIFLEEVRRRKKFIENAFSERCCGNIANEITQTLLIELNSFGLTKREKFDVLAKIHFLSFEKLCEQEGKPEMRELHNNPYGRRANAGSSRRRKIMDDVMTVGGLIEKLQEYDPDEPIGAYDGESREIRRIKFSWIQNLSPKKLVIYAGCYMDPSDNMFVEDWTDEAEEV